MFICKQYCAFHLSTVLLWDVKNMYMLLFYLSFVFSFIIMIFLGNGCYCCDINDIAIFWEMEIAIVLRLLKRNNRDAR